MEITAKTKIFDLLAAYPQLEEKIMNIASPFKNLKNPVLRRTVGKLADLEKAASIGEMKVSALVNILRREVGQAELKVGTEISRGIVETGIDWIKGEPAQLVDGVEMLNQGQHPLNRVNELMLSMHPGGYLILYTNFKPLPLIEAMEKQGYRVHHTVDRDNSQKHITYVGKS